MQAAIFLAIGALIGTIITALVNRTNKTLEVRMEAQQRQYDQLQEDLNAEREQRRRDIDRIHELLRISHIQEDYMGRLRQHINDEKPPPPPPWPAELMETN